MKKKAMLLLIPIVLSVSSCGKVSNDHHPNGIHVYFDTGAARRGNDYELIDYSYYDSMQGVWAATEEVGTFFVGNGNYVLFTDVCPVCY